MVKMKSELFYTGQFTILLVPIPASLHGCVLICRLPAGKVVLSE